MNAPVRWEVIQVRLHEPLQAMSAPKNAAGGYLVFWWKDIALGHSLIYPEEFPLNEAELQRRVAHAVAPAVGNYVLQKGFKPPLPILRQKPADNLSTTLESLVALGRPLENLATNVLRTNREFPVSVIVCTRRRPAELRRCLAALQQLDPYPTEIIVVDNAPEESSTLEVVEEFDEVIYLTEPIPGLSHARNRGILRSSGEVLAFTDDDVVVSPRWLVGIREALSQGSCSGMTGLVLAAQLETESQIQFELEFGGFNGGYRPVTFDSFFFNSMLDQGVPVWRIGAGANMAFRREVFGRIGLFDERLGAGAAGCSEDSEFWYRMLAAGMSIVYQPRAVVWHTHRVEREAFRNQMKHYMRGHVAALLVQFEKHRHIGNLRRLLIELPHYYYRRLKRMPLKGGSWGLLCCELLGYASGFIAYFHQSLSGVRIAARRVNLPKRKSVKSVVSHKHKRRLLDFLRDNPFPHPFTAGLFYREKMRAIHRIAPDLPLENILEVGGGRSGLTSMLYPTSRVTNVDLNCEYVSAPCNQRSGVRFVCGNATDLPFENESFDAVTMFDLLEHVPDDHRAVREGFRVLRPGGFLLVSAPNENWRFPYYQFMRACCPPEEKLFAEWGHVRRGYSRAEIEGLVGFPASRTATFINPLTVLYHDIGFSSLPRRQRVLYWAILSPIAVAAYALHRAGSKGTETAYVWIKPHVRYRTRQRRITSDQPIQATR